MKENINLRSFLKRADPNDLSQRSKWIGDWRKGCSEEGDISAGL